MKKIYLPLFIGVFALLSFVLFRNPMAQFEDTPNFKLKNHEPLDQIIEGRAEERARQLANNQTGKVNPEDWYRALREIMSRDKNITTRANDILWEQQGPDQVGGRIRGFIFDKTKEGRCYASGVSGGIFVSQDLGFNWQPIPKMDEIMPVMSIGCMVQSIEGDIYAGTGEYWGNPVNGSFGSQFYGNGIYKKEASSAEWVHLTSTISTSPLTTANHTGNFRMVIDMACDRKDNKIVYAATERGLFKSTDAGTTWNLLSSFGTVPVAQIKIAINDDLFAAKQGKVFRSTDGGATWTDLIGSNANYTSTNSNNHVRIAISELNAGKLYVCGVDGANDLKYVIKSENAGSTWEFLGKGDAFLNPLCNEIDGQRVCQGWYDMCLATHPKNDDILFLGGAPRMYSWSKLYGWVQMTNGYAPTVLGDKQVHADMHEFVFHPTHPDTMVVCTDGGPYMSYNSTKNFPTNVTWTPRFTKLNTTQFYDIDANKYGELLGGAQDNGSQLTSLRGISKNLSLEASGGDGFGCAISASNDYQVAFTTVYNGTLNRTSDLSSNRKNIVVGSCASSTTGQLSGVGFNTRIHLSESIIPVPEQDGFDSVEFSFLFGFSGAGVFISNDAYKLTERTDWTPLMGLGIGSVMCAHQSSNLDAIYFGGTGGVRKSTTFRTAKFEQDANASSPCLRTTGLTFASTTGTSNIGGIYVDQKDKDHVVAVQFGFGAGPKVFETTNGSTFVGKQGNLPLMPVYSCAINPEDSKHVIIGTEFGIWETKDISVASPVWEEQNKNIGRIPVFKLVIKILRDKDCPVLYAGTHGRGFFRVPFPDKGTLCDYTIKPRVKTGTSGLNPAINKLVEFNIYPNPASDIVNVTFADKTRGDYYLKIYDMGGREVKSVNYHSLMGDNIIKTNISSLKGGNYIVRLENETSVIGGKILTIK